MPASRQKGPRIHDVASAAGVSTSTVSRVLNGSSEVSAASVSAVEEAVRRLGYVPDMFARGLRQGRTQSVGVSVADLRYPAFTDFVRSLSDVVGSRRYPVVLADAMWDAEIEELRVRELVTGRVDALVALLPQDMRYIERAAEEGTPVLAVVRRYHGTSEAMPALTIDDEMPLRGLLSRVARLGHRRVHYITRDARWSARTAYLSGLATDYSIEIIEAPISPDRVRYIGRWDPEQPLLPDAYFETERPTCIIVAQHVAAVVLAQMRRLALRIPDDVSVIVNGCTDWGFAYEPPLDALEIDYAGLGAAAGKYVLELLDGEQPRPEAFQSEYVVRASTGPAQGA